MHCSFRARQIQADYFRAFGYHFNQQQALKRAVILWQKYCYKNTSGSTAIILENIIVEIACHLGYGSGYWSIYPSSPQEADRLWVVVALAVQAGILGVSAMANAGIICVYVDPLWDKKEVDRVLWVLRRHCGVTTPLYFRSSLAAYLLQPPSQVSAASISFASIYYASQDSCISASLATGGERDNCGGCDREKATCTTRPPPPPHTTGPVRVEP